MFPLIYFAATIKGLLQNATVLNEERKTKRENRKDMVFSDENKQKCPVWNTTSFHASLFTKWALQTILQRPL